MGENNFLDRSDIPGNAFSFSGYPGSLASGDDYTLVNSGLVSAMMV
jgi:hypothetical protein